MRFSDLLLFLQMLQPEIHASLKTWVNYAEWVHTP
jgi:hypothetical protein